MDHSGRISGLQGLVARRTLPTSSALMKWADQEIGLSALENLESSSSSSNLAGLVEPLAKRPATTRSSRNIGAAVKHTVQRHSLIEAWTELVDEIGSSS